MPALDNQQVVYDPYEKQKPKRPKFDLGDYTQEQIRKFKENFGDYFQSEPEPVNNSRFNSVRGDHMIARPDHFSVGGVGNKHSMTQEEADLLPENWFMNDGDTYTKSAEDWAKQFGSNGKTKSSSEGNSYTGSPEDRERGMDDQPYSEFGRGDEKKGQSHAKAKELTPERIKAQGDKELKADNDQIKDFKKRLAKFKGEKAKVDLSGLMNTVDALTGSNLRAGYQAPMSQEEKDQIAAEAETKLIGMKNDVAYKQQVLKQKIEDSKSLDIYRKTMLANNSKASVLKFQTEYLKLKNKEAEQPEKLAKFIAKDFEAKQTSFGKKNGPLEFIARNAPKEKNEGEYDWQSKKPAIHKLIYEKGQAYEKSGKSQLGMGYNDALIEVTERIRKNRKPSE